MPEPIILWRAYVPRWADAPLSGDGAARFGGRWNPVGAVTIYAARELSTAWAEYNQGFVQHPALVAQLRLEGARLADLTNPEVLTGLGIDEAIHRCEWRDDLDAGRLPATHLLRERLIREGQDGAPIHPSCRRVEPVSPSGTGMASTSRSSLSRTPTVGCRKARLPGCSWERRSLSP
jgi:RES domain-containing protein